MRKTNAKQMILGILGSFVCGAGVMGCYPLVPAYFAALYLERVSGLLLMGFMYIGMIFFMPLTAAVKYGVVLLVIAGAIRLVEWVQEGCPAFLAGILAAVSTLILSFCGSLLEWREQPEAAAVFLEAVFVFGAVILLNRLLHRLMEYQPAEIMVEEKSERGNGEKLMNYAESFQGLSHIFYNMSQKKNRYTAEELGQIQNELTGKMCASCESCAVCWERDATPLYGIISGMISSIWHVGTPAEEQERELSRYCLRSKDMVEEAVHVFERVNLNRAWYNRLLENRQVIAEQLDAMAYIMKDCAREEKILDRQERGMLAEIRYRAKEHGITVENIHLIETAEGRLKLEAALKSRMGGCISMKTFVAAAERAMNKKLRLPADSKTFISKEVAEFALYEDTLYRNVQGIARIKKDGAQISGDNFSFLELERGELVLGISDGMGSGSTACKESEMVLDLLERFLEAGFSVETATRMMNSAMVMRGDNDLYSTVDLCKINLYTGMAEFYKIGAAAAFIKREQGVECIASSSLPVGVETQFEIEKQQRQLGNGDFVVMVTDGVLEHLGASKPEETMQEMIESIQTNNPGILAKRIMERVMLFTGGKAEDDMTVLTACIWEK